MYANYMFERDGKRFLIPLDEFNKLNFTDAYSTIFDRNDLDFLYITNNNGVPNIPIPTAFTTKFMYPK